MQKDFLASIFSFISKLLVCTAFFFSSSASYGASEKISYPKLDWSFKGLTGTFDRSSQQRGLQVYKEVCSGCHGLRLLAYRNLQAIGYNDDEIKAFASENSVNSINDDGAIFDGRIYFSQNKIKILEENNIEYLGIGR